MPERVKHVLKDGSWFLEAESIRILDPFQPETLFHTKKGTWVLRIRSLTGPSEHWEILSYAKAKAWMVQRGLISSLNEEELEI